MAKNSELHRQMCKMAGLGREKHAGGGAAGSALKKNTRLGHVQKSSTFSEGGAATKTTLKDGRAIKMPRQAVPGTPIAGIKAARKGQVAPGLAKASHFKKGGAAERAKHAGGGAVSKVRKDQYKY
jgi:hypothetical protein